MEKTDFAKAFHASRQRLFPAPPEARNKDAEEGGCGVTGFACSVPVGGKHIFEPSRLMHNRGNGKGGGIAAAGLVPEDLGVTRDVLDSCYLLQVALLEPDCRGALEAESILPFFDVVQSSLVPTLDDYREVEGLEIRPPDVVRYFVRAKKDQLARFAEENDLAGFSEDQVESEFIWQKNILLNRRFYDTAGEKSAFVMSQGRNIVIFKIVGYAEQVAQYYKLDDVRAHIWIAHQRYPTKGRVWHPAGAHPFMGMDVALVHNGDFANYFSVAEYLRQKNIYPHFHTDTEVAVLMFDLLNRVYGYPLEYIVEALAPTTEMDFDRLPEDKQKVYGKLHHTHIHGSPDGPWFFIIARNDVKNKEQQLIGITDTAMLRPQVFAFHDGEIQVALVCSEKQAIDATLASLNAEDSRIGTVADRYWNARGGSYTDGGTFVFTVKDDPDAPGKKRLTIADKFGTPVTIEKKLECNLAVAPTKPADADALQKGLDGLLAAGDSAGAFSFLTNAIATRDFHALRFLMETAVAAASRSDRERKAAIAALTDLNDRRYPTGSLRRRSVLQIVRAALKEIFAAVPPMGSDNVSSFRLISLETRDKLAAPTANQETLVLNAAGFEPEGDLCDARLVVDAYGLGWRKFICYGYRGQRFLGCGLGPATEGVTIDVYGSSGDYLASGIDGMTIRVHGNAQDQLGQILKNGKLVIYGDVGQTFMYGAKGGEVFVMGNAAGRPLINGVGKPRVVINGTALDYLAESFMAGDALKGGGFVILNGVTFDHDGKVVPLTEPYPGSNLFSLASGGAIFVRDPHGLLVEEQLNEGAFLPLSKADWRLILPYLTENEKLFGISVEDDLLKVDGEYREPQKVYRKIVSKKAAQLAKETVNE
ncbi:MAG: glutamate synthase [Thermodesulfobacteriota bacterium]